MSPQPVSQPALNSSHSLSCSAPEAANYLLKEILDVETMVNERENAMCFFHPQSVLSAGRRTGLQPPTMNPALEPIPFERV